MKILNTKRHISIITILVLVAVVISSLGEVRSVHAMNPPALETFYVPLPEDQMLQYFVDVFNPAGAAASVSPLRSIISISIGTEGTEVYYDQWEDSNTNGVYKYDADIANPDGNYYNAVTNPKGTQIWGDGNVFNGCPPSINNIPNPCKSPSDDMLHRGDTVTLDSWVTVDGASGSYYRDNNKVYYDGHDKIGASMPVSVTRAIYPTGPGSLVADAQNVLPTERWGTHYISPVGENTTNGGGTQSFDDTRLQVMGMTNGTLIRVDTNGDGTYEVNNQTINEGQVLSFNGPAGTVNGATDIKTGAQVDVVSGGPVQTTLITSDYSSNYENRYYNLLPYTQYDYQHNTEVGWTNDYYSPVGTGTQAGLGGCTNDWVYNPSRTTAITVYYDFVGGASPDGSFNIPVNSSVASPNVPAGSGVHFYTTGSPAPVFLPISMTDCTAGTNGGNGDIFDWGNELYTSKILSPELLIGWALGCSDTSYEGICLDYTDLTHTSSRNVVWLTPLANTTIYVDTNGSGIDCTNPAAGAEKIINATALTSYEVNDDPTSRGYVYDNFNGAIYTHNNAFPNTFTGTPTPVQGTWGSNWVETGDDGSATTGSIYINTTAGYGGTGALQFRNNGNETGMSIRRELPNVSGYKFSELTFRLNVANAPTSPLDVQVSPDGTNWTTLEKLTGTSVNNTYAALANDQLASRTYRLTKYNSANTYIRFYMEGDLTGAQTYSIDDVQVDYAPDGDYDMTGTYIRTCDDTLLAAAFGQDPLKSFSGDDEALDLGNGVSPYGSQIKLTKSASADFVKPGDQVTYTYTVRLLQTFSVAVNNVSVTDDSCSPATYVSGDTNGNGFLEPGEVFTFSCTTRLYTQTTDTALGYALYGNDRIRSNPAQALVKLTSSVGDYVWVDENGDGIQDAGEPGIPNVKLTLTGTNLDGGAVSMTTYTDASGHYAFNNVPPSNASGYAVAVDTTSMAAGLAANETYDENGVATPNTTTVVLGSDVRYKTADFGYNWSSVNETDNNTGTGMIGDRVWSDYNGNGIQDAGEIGLNNVTVELVGPGADGLFSTSDDVILQTTTTDYDGNYYFDNLPAGAYQVVIPSIWPGYTQTGDPDQPLVTCTTCDGKTTMPIVLAPGDVYLNDDFGYQLNPQTGTTIGDTLWVDTNRNNVVDSGEPPLAGVSVSLIRDLNANGVWDAGEPIISTTYTDANGHYAFTGVPVADGTGTDDYLVWVNDTNHVVAEVTPTYDSDGSNPTSGVAIGLGISSVLNLTSAGDLNQDFAYAPASQASGSTALVGDTVWLDENNNGVFDAGEGIEGVIVNLLDSSGQIITRTRTNVNGQYFFSGLAAGTYTVDLNLNSLPAFGTNLTNFVDPDGGRPNRATFTLSSSQVLLNEDFGYQDTGTTGHTISGTFWNDVNASGVLDASEAGRYAGVTVALYTDSNDNGVLDNTDMLIGTTTTDASGNYSFTGLPDDTYWVDVTDTNQKLLGTWHSYGTAGLDNNSQTDPYKIVLSGADNSTADFGYYRDPAAIGDYVWTDTNKDGLQTSGETGIPNDLVTMVITYPNGAGTTTLNTLTDANGNYKFGNLLLDEDFNGGTGAGQPTYSLTFATPSGDTPTTALVGSDRTIDSDGNSNVTAYAYKGTYNNTVDSGFYPTALTIAKTSDVSTAVAPGGTITYTITVTNNTSANHTAIVIGDPLPAGTTYVANSTAATGPASYVDTFDAVAYNNSYGTLNWAANSWTETGDDGNPATGDINIVAESGSNRLHIQAASKNIVRIAPLNGYTSATLTFDRKIVNLAAGHSFYLDASTDGTTWNTLLTWTGALNDSGYTTESVSLSAYLVAGARIRFRSGTGLAATEDLYIDNVIITTNSTVTKDNITGGTYPDLLNGTPPNLVVAGDNFSLAPGKSMTITYKALVNNPETLYTINNTASAQSAQMTSPVYASHSDAVQWPSVIGDRVWLDENSDGVQDAGEEGIPNVTVQLWNSAHTTILQSTTTDSEGNYLFTNVPAGTYQVDVLTSSMPAGLAANPTYDENGTSTPNTTTVTVGQREEHLTADFGYNWATTTEVTNPPASGATGTIGDQIWIDANGDGVQNPGEPGLAGVSVALKTAGPDGIMGTADDVTAATTTTNTAGYYIFDGLAAGAYQVVVNGGSAPTGYTQTGDADQPSQTCTVCDNKTTTPILLAPGDVYVNADFGYHPNTTLNTIGDQIFLDANSNGTYNSGTDLGISGVTVALLDSGGNVIATTVTNSSGQYSFTGVPNGTYTVWVNDTNHVLDHLTQDSTPNNAANNGQACGTCNNKNTFTTGTPNLFQDFGYVPVGNGSGTGMIGDTVYLDRNNNNTPDAGEGIEGVHVWLYQDNNNNKVYDSGDTLLAETTTNDNGNYYFDKLPAGNYVVKVDTTTLPSGLTNTKDPDTANPGDSQSGVTLATSTSINLDQDFGYQKTTSPNTIGGTIWNDANADGTLTSGEAGRFAGVTVNLYTDTNKNGKLDGADMLVGTTTTDSSGNYSFGDLPNGSYFVDVTDTTNVLNGYWHTIGPNPNVDNNSQYEPYAVTVAGGQTNTTGDFGYYIRPASIGDFAFYDLNGDGIQNANEPGIPNVPVTLTVTYPNGSTSTETILTDSTGHYNIGNLLLDESYNGQGPYGSGGQSPKYVISVATPTNDIASPAYQGSNTAIDSGNGVAGQQSQPLRGSSDPTVDFGFFRADFGDDPNTYDTLYSSNGPRNILFPDTNADGLPNSLSDGTAAIWLGPTVTAKTDGNPSGTASSDPSDDGVSLVNPGNWFQGTNGGTISVTFDSSSSGSNSGYLVVWFDWNNNGAFDPATEAAVNTSVSWTGTSSTQQFTFNIPTGGNALGTDLFYRARLFASAPSNPTTAFVGSYTNGETEDYYAPVGTLPVTMDYFYATRVRGTLSIDWETGTETGNLGFNLYLDNGKSWEKINTGLVPAKGFTTHDPQDYHIEVSAGVLNGKVKFYLEDVDILGRTVLHGPFELDQVNGMYIKPIQTDWQKIGALDASLLAARNATNSQAVDKALLGRLKANAFQNNNPEPNTVQGNPGKGIPLAKATATFTPTRTSKPTRTFTPTKTLKPTKTPTPNLTWTVTLTPSLTLTFTLTPSFTPTFTLTTTPTMTPVTPTDTLVPSDTPVTPTDTLVPSDTPVPPTDTLVTSDTPVPPTATPVPQPAVKIGDLLVSQTGIYRVSYEDLLAAGLNLGGQSAADLALKLNGTPVAILVSSGDTFGPGSYIEFYGQAVDTLYTNTSDYSLWEDQASALRVSEDRTVTDLNSQPASYYMETALVDVNNGYNEISPTGDPWYNAEMVAYGIGAGSWNYPLSVDHYQAGTPGASLLVNLYGGTDFPASPDHHIVVSFNGSSLADQKFDGLVAETVSVALPAGKLAEGSNTLTITLPADLGVEADVVYLDKYSLTYPRAFWALNGGLKFEAKGSVYAVQNLMDGNVEVYRLQNGMLTKVDGVVVTATGGTYTARFNGSAKDGEYYVVGTSALLKPGIQAARPYTEINSGKADYLIISHPDFISGLSPLVSARTAQGLKVKVVDVKDIYDQYSYGVVDPQAIKSYITYAAAHMGTKYVLLVGDDTYDYKNYLGLGSISYIPSIYKAVGDLVQYAPVDPEYADVNNDGIPELAIGRLAVRTPAELGNLVAKILAYGGKGYGKTGVFAADSTYGNASNALIGALPTGWASSTAYVDQEGVTAAHNTLMGSINGGVALTSFVGHTDDWEWTWNGLFDIYSAAQLTNAGKPTLVMQEGCWNNYYVNPTYETLQDAMLNVGLTGAAGMFGSTTLTSDENEQAYGQLLVQMLTKPGMTIGRAEMLAKQAFALRVPNGMDILLGTNLLGDPALVVTP